MVIKLILFHSYMDGEGRDGVERQARLLKGKGDSVGGALVTNHS